MNATVSDLYATRLAAQFYHALATAERNARHWHSLVDGPLRIAGAEIGVADDLGGERATVGFRPETVVIGDGAVAGRIRIVEDLGSEVFVHLVIDHEGEERRIVAKAAAPRVEGQVGVRVSRR